MHQVARSGARRADAARHQVRPGVDVIAGVTDHRGFAGGATGGMDAGALRARHGKHAVGVAVAQIAFGGEGKLGQIRQALAIAGVHTGRIKFGFVNRRVGIGMLQGRLQALELQAAQFIHAGVFDGLMGEGVLGVHGFTTVPGICALLPRNKATVSPRWLVTFTS